MYVCMFTVGGGGSGADGLILSIMLVDVSQSCRLLNMFVCFYTGL